MQSALKSTPTSQPPVAEVLGVADADVGVHDGLGGLPRDGVVYAARLAELVELPAEEDEHADADRERGDEDGGLQDVRVRPEVPHKAVRGGVVAEPRDEILHYSVALHSDGFLNPSC